MDKISVLGQPNPAYFAYSHHFPILFAIKISQIWFRIISLTIGSNPVKASVNASDLGN